MESDLESSRVKEDSDRILGLFHPIATRFGFRDTIWDYDPESEIVRVEFENGNIGTALQIDHHIRADSYNANYCRIKGDWQICIEGKPQSLPKFKSRLSSWILDNCEECRSEKKEEDLEF